MAVVESLLQFPSTGTLLGAFLLLLVLYLLSSGSKSQKKGKEPPGPKPLPLLGNLLTLDLTRPFDTFFEVKTWLETNSSSKSSLTFWYVFVNVFLCVLQLSKTYGNIFQVFLGSRKSVVLVGYKTIKEALVNHAEEFGERDIAPMFKLMNKDHGRIFFFFSKLM